MTTIEWIFWTAMAVVIYTYAGYGIVLRLCVAVREALRPRAALPDPDPWPEVTVLIAAYNEQEVVDAKMRNTLGQDYPGPMRIVWVTDGSTDATVERLKAYPQAEVLHDPQRRGKTAALNRAFALLETPIVVCTDANTMISPEAVREMVRLFADGNVGCVAGEKRVSTGDGTAVAAEGLYWRYESKLKEWDDRLRSACGAAGELFAVRRELYRPVEEDTLLDDFVISMRIAARGYRIAYCKAAYALEPPSADMREEGKRKRRIAAGGLQAIVRLPELLDPLRCGILSWQYLSHRVLRWSLTPVLLAALLPLNVVLVLTGPHAVFYGVLLAGQALFYGAAVAGWLLARRGVSAGPLYVPYYFLFMNYNVFRGVAYLFAHKGSGVWEKARRAA